MKQTVGSFTIGELVKVVRGEFAGTIMRVGEGSYVSSDAGPQIVLQTQHDGRWLDFSRCSEAEAAYYTQRV